MGEGAGPTGIERHRIDMAASKGGGGGGGKDRFIGPDKKPWATWLVKDPKEAKTLTNPNVEKEVARIARLPDSMLTADILRRTFYRLEELNMDGKATDAEVAPWAERIAAKTETLSSTPPVVVSPTPAPMDTKEFGRSFAEALGTPRPERQLEFYRSFEEKHTAFRIVPGSPPPFLVLYEGDTEEWDRQFKIWEMRSILTMAAAQKTVAASVDSVANPVREEAGYNDPFGVEFKKERLEFLFKNLPGVLPAMSIYATIIGGEKFLGRNPEHLKDVLLNITDGEIKNLGYSSEETKKLVEERDGLKNAIPESVWASDEPGFYAIRKSIRFFLQTKGRHLLFLNNDEGKAILKSEWTNKILEDRARDAEQPAWNFIFTTGLLESFNTREECWYIREKRGKQLGPSNFMTLYLWMLLHPQQRFEDKISKPGGTDSVLAKEDWSMLGSWGVNHVMNKWWPIDTSGKKPRLIVPKILRPDLIQDALRHGDKKGKGNRGAFYDFFTEVGPQLLKKPSGFRHEDLSVSMTTRDEWKGLGDSPFVPYRFDILRWGGAVFKVFKKGPGAERDVSLADMAEAFRNLNLSFRERMALLVIRFGHNTKHRDLIYVEGKLSWMASMLPEIKRASPDIFKDATGKNAKEDFEGAGERVKIIA